MTICRLQHVAMWCLFLVASVHTGFAQRQPSQAPPAKQSGVATHKEGFVDFTLKRINPRNEDYGKCINDGRELLISETLENGYFWSNVTALGLLGLFFAVIVYQRKLRVRRELMNAQVLCQMENSLVRANEQATTATKHNHDLMAALTAARESGQPHSVQMQNRVADSPPQTQIPAMVVAAEPAVDSKESATVVLPLPDKRKTSAPPQLGLFSPDVVDQVATINALQQQLLRCQERVKNLTRQLNEAERRVQDEQQKNRSLKGQ
ncbi:MAG TPA: hypothetical protein VFK06_17685 [Candidatus Angelobacter sp.]|nr:hypothetical protein [Candidatus Angelobacter sp.]